MRSIILNSKYSVAKNNNGFSIIEILLCLGLVVGAAIMLNSYMSNISKAKKNTIILMAFDTVERQITLISGKHSIVEFSIQKAFDSGELNFSQINCFIKKFNCDSISTNSSINLALQVNDGVQTQKITGPNAIYGYSGDRCTKSCPGVTVSTTIYAVCQTGKTCTGPDFFLVQNSYSVTTPEVVTTNKNIQLPTRIRTQEVRPSMASKLFPGISIACPDKNQVLNGISLTGKPMCTPLAKLEYEDRPDNNASGSFKITATDCGQSSYISEIRDPSGEVICTPKFW